jgi:integrase/recombinase XerD
VAEPVNVMSDLNAHVADYLRLRRGLGFKLAFAGHVLPQFVAYLTGIGASSITVDAAIAWAGLPQGVKPISLAHRLGAVRQFAKYVATLDPATEIPPCGVWPSTSPRPTPYVWSPADIGRLLDAAGRMESPLRAVTHETLFGLLASTGMRIGEAINLTIDDVDLADGVVMIRDAKFGRSRLVPLHETVTRALNAYTAQRERLCPIPNPVSFFVSTTGTPLCHGTVQIVFRALTTELGLRTSDCRPRIHDLRHAFAVRTLIDWHQTGVDIGARLPVLSTYLGHVNPAGTYWYLTAVPELMTLAAERLDTLTGEVRP